MLERYYIRPETVDRVRASWIGEAISKYVVWLNEQGYAARTVYRRLPILMRFGEFAWNQGARRWDELAEHVEAFVTSWIGERYATRTARKDMPRKLRNPIQQMLRRVLPDFARGGRQQRLEPFRDQAPHF